MNANEIIAKAITYVSETEMRANQSSISLTTISNSAKTAVEPLRGDKLIKAKVWVLEKLSSLYGPYRVSRDGPWIDYLGKLTADQVKKTVKLLESKKTNYKYYAPTAIQFYNLALETDGKISPEEQARREERSKHLEEVRQMLWSYLLTKGKLSQSEASLGDFFERTAIALPQEVKNLVMDKIRPLNEEILQEMSKRNQFWMGWLPHWLYRDFE